jgi:hypothetical protein
VTRPIGVWRDVVVIDVSRWDHVGLDLLPYAWKEGSRIGRFGFRI